MSHELKTGTWIRTWYCI